MNIENRIKPKIEQKVEQKVEQKAEQINNEWEVVAWINTLNVYDPVRGGYTEAINPNTLIVKTNELEGGRTVGYISTKTLEAFLEGNKRSVPIKIKKEN